MSMYNIIHGENPFSTILLGILGLTRENVPRYRDCWWTGNQIAVHTRTGGGNRDYYENLESCRDNYPEYFKGTEEDPHGPWNDDLRQLATFKKDLAFLGHGGLCQDCPECTYPQCAFGKGS